MTVIPEAPIGVLVRQWRERRRRSQLDVSIAADLSARHLSFIETGRSRPSGEMLERLCEELEVPLRERNRLHLAAGFAPPHPERPLTDLGAARAAVDALLTGHEPYPAMAVDVGWRLLGANTAATGFLGEVAPALRTPPVNVLRTTLHPDGLAPRLRNYAQWRGHLASRIRRQAERTARPELVDLLAEVEGFPVPAGCDLEAEAPGDLVVPMVLDSPAGELRLLYSLTVFGAARDVTLDEIAIESFFPADEATRARLQAG